MDNSRHSHHQIKDQILEEEAQQPPSPENNT